MSDVRRRQVSLASRLTGLLGLTVQTLDLFEVLFGGPAALRLEPFTFLSPSCPLDRFGAFTVQS